MDPRVVIFHVTAVEGDARPHSGLEWHFEVSYSGAIEQGVDTNQQAAANYKANPFAISVETEGTEFGEWTDRQLDSLVLISEWCMENHPLIRRQRCDRWDGSGFGYHTMWGAPSQWTPVAKSCPGPKRKRQFDEVLLPRILAPQEDDMTPEQVAVLSAIHGEVKNIRATGINTETALVNAQTQLANVEIRLEGLSRAVAALAAGDGASAQEIVDELAKRLVEG